MQNSLQSVKNKYPNVIMYFLLVFTIICIFVTGFISFNIGYKEGQLDYAQDYIKYTVIDGRIIKFMGTVKEVKE